MLRTSAAILRTRGYASAANRAELAASRVDLVLDEPHAVARMYGFVRHLAAASHHRELLERALDGALALLGADLGHIQLRDPATGSPRIVTQAGVPDLAPHPPMTGASALSAAQSTLLIETDGRVRGVLWTHSHRPHEPRRRDVQLISWYGELVAAAMTSQQRAPTLLYRTAVDSHETAAERHDATAAVMRTCAESFAGHGATASAGQAQMFAAHADTRALLARRRAGARRRLSATPPAGTPERQR